MKKFNNNDIMKFTKEDFLKYRNTKIKITLKEKITITDTLNSGKIFNGYYNIVFLSAYAPHLPGSINFVEESVNKKIVSDFPREKATDINVFNIDCIEILD